MAREAPGQLPRGTMAAYNRGWSDGYYGNPQVKGETLTYYQAYDSGHETREEDNEATLTAAVEEREALETSITDGLNEEERRHLYGDETP